MNIKNLPPVGQHPFCEDGPAESIRFEVTEQPEIGVDGGLVGKHKFVDGRTER